jgi:DNA-binding transcriptional LysR family regulator
VVIPRLPGFMAAHPQLRVTLQLEDHRQDLISQGIDVALRFGALEDSSAVARKMRSWPRIAAASPGYLAKAGVPQNPADLASCQVFASPANNGAGLTLRKGSQVASVKVDCRANVSTNEGRIAAAVAGMGIVISTSGSCAQEIADGVLVRVLEEWDLGQVDLHAVYAVGRQAKPAARAFTEFLLAELARLPRHQPRLGKAGSSAVAFGNPGSAPPD